MPASSGWSPPEAPGPPLRGWPRLRWALPVLAVALLVTGVAVVVTVPPTLGQATQTWYARSTDTGLAACGGFDKDLSQTAGSAAVTQTLSTGTDYCFYTTAQTLTLESGDWTAFVELTISGVGQPSQVRITLDITDSAGAVLETVADCTLIDNPSGEVQCAATGVAQKALDDDRVRLRVQKTQGATTVTLHYDDASGTSGDTRAVFPAEAACSALTVVTSDPAGQLWFNETVEPDGQAYTTEVNVSASFQDGTTPALNVTNDGSANCDITLRLMSDPGTGRSMKFNVTSNAPWPDDATREVPVDPSSVTACTGVAPGGTCDVWLWVDYENALGGSLSVTLRVEST